MILAITLHILAAVIWVGGMFFAYMALRPTAAKLLEPPLRLTLWLNVFNHFFPWVWASMIILLASGGWMIVVFGGMASIGIHIHLMLLLGLVMSAIFVYLYFKPYRHLGQAVANSDWPTGGKALNQIRQLIAVNLTIGLIVVILASGGRYF